MSKEDIIYIFHIKDSLIKILEYSNEVNKKEFEQKSIIQDAVIRQIEIIGEASSKLSKEFKSKNNIIPWKNIIGMRNKLIHDYFGVDINAIWETIRTDIPKLKTEIELILNKYDQQLNFKD